jgi:dihydroneopterin aldolase
MTSDDHISIHGLSVTARVGVPEEERSAAQRLKLNLILWPARGLAGLRDSVENTVDYDEAARLVRKVAADGERKLIETLADDVARALLGRFSLRRVSVEVVKFILPDTDWVAVRIQREGSP